jgi:hypothetical protein
MRIELKNISVNLRMSEETTAFIADIYLDNQKIGHCRNDGRGGCTMYNAYEGKRDKLVEAEKYAETLPPFVYGNLTVKSNLEALIDNLLDKYVTEAERKKFIKKRENATKTCLVVGNPNGNTFRTISFGKLTIDEMVKHPTLRFKLKDYVEKLKKELPKDEIIFNENLQFS